MSTTDQRECTSAITDPVAAMAGLAATTQFGEYVLYERPGEWTFAADPLATVKLTTTETIVEAGENIRRTTWSGRPTQALAQGIVDAKMGSRDLYGWLAFEFGAWQSNGHRKPETPLAYLMAPRIVVRCQGTRLTISGADPHERATIYTAIDTAQRQPIPRPRPVDVRGDDTGYRDRVATAVEEIRAGKYQKVILSRKVPVPFAVDIPATYRLGRQHNTPARAFALRLGGLQAAGFSPELVATVDAGRVVTTQPLAGTRAFGRGARADAAARTDLLRDPKELVEHALSVQTSVAEVTQVCLRDTTVIRDFLTIQERGSVQHLASRVQGQLAADCCAWDALASLFPAVTASGIPKAEGLDAIFRLDAEARGLYSGAVFTMTPRGVLDAALVLRAVYQTADGAWLRAGAGIVEQSRPEREFEETCEKLESIAPHVVPANTPPSPSPNG